MVNSLLHEPTSLSAHHNHPRTHPITPLHPFFIRSSLAFNGITGPLPPEWGGLTSLRLLKLDNNKLRGPVPKAWAPPSRPSMAQLETLSLYRNKDLDGCLPASLANEGAAAAVLQAVSGRPTRDTKQAGQDTKITGFCS